MAPLPASGPSSFKEGRPMRTKLRTKTKWSPPEVRRGLTSERVLCEARCCRVRCQGRRDKGRRRSPGRPRGRQRSRRWAGRNPRSRPCWPGRSQTPSVRPTRRSAGGTTAGPPHPGVGRSHRRRCPGTAPARWQAGASACGRARPAAAGVSSWWIGGSWAWAYRAAWAVCRAPWGASGRACFRTPVGVIPIQWSLPMPAARARQIVLAACDRHRLKRLERSQTAPWRQVLRAKIVLLAARGMANQKIAARLGVTADTARKWRGRLAADGMAGLAREAVTRGIATAVSASTVGRWLAGDAIKPWQHRSWIFIRDPDFGAKASRVLDLYARRFQVRPLGTIDRHQAVHGPGHPGHDPGALRLGQAGVLDR